MEINFEIKHISFTHLSLKNTDHSNFQLIYEKVKILGLFLKKYNYIFLKIFQYCTYNMI